MPAFISITDAVLVHLRKADLFKSVMPSKIFKAAGMAKPIICGVEGDAASLVQQAGGGVCIEPENAAQLVEALEGLVRKPARGAALGQAGYEYISSNFNRDQLSGKYLKVIREIV